MPQSAVIMLLLYGPSLKNLTYVLGSDLRDLRGHVSDWQATYPALKLVSHDQLTSPSASALPGLSHASEPRPGLGKTHPTKQEKCEARRYAGFCAS
jgi:hypothetical protein